MSSKFNMLLVVFIDITECSNLHYCVLLQLLKFLVNLIISFTETLIFFGPNSNLNFG